MGAIHRSAILIGLIVAAACSSPSPKGKETIENITIEDHFITCVTPDLDTWPIGSATCPHGWRQGGVCLLPNGQKEFVEDTEAAVKACEKRGHLK
jgi:hypothetical protein